MTFDNKNTLKQLHISFLKFSVRFLKMDKGAENKLARSPGENGGG
jgi:hypothetical protein